MMNFIIALITGLAVGAHNSTWGMYKDSPHEGFTYRKYFRSIIYAGIVGPIVWYVSGMDMTKATSIVLLFGATYLLERATMEVWKTFLRTEDQSKYFIPMQLHVFGKVIESRAARYIVAFFYVGIMFLIAYGVHVLYVMYKSGDLSWHPYLIILVLSVGGWISAFGGAWKDAPLEGFETFKFFRSPGIAFFYAWVTANLTDNFYFIAMCSLGFTVASIETYKTFFFPSRPRGKFAGKPILFPEMLQKRQKFVPLYVAIWLYVIIAAVLAFTGPHQGLI